MLLPSFNEAALFRTRKGYYSSGDGGGQTRFNEAALFRTRKATLSCIVSKSPSSFNEAALFRTRKVEQPSGSGRLLAELQ